MDVSLDKDWKEKLGFQINYKSDQSSEDDPDLADVVMRRGSRPARSAADLLDDAGDGSEADQLSSTPPRALIRTKEKARRGNLDEAGFQKMVRDNRRNTTVYVSGEQAVVPDRLKKRWSLKRSTDREWKQEMGQRENKADSLPSPDTTPAVPTLVESCNRFMSLTSRLKCPRAERPERLCRGAGERGERGGPGAGGAGERAPEGLPDSRVTFHQTFSMLINMGNVDKTCKRGISREEQVWQNELKDLIWLELQAKIAGRSLAQQDAYLCAQRNEIPNLIKNIIDYRFVNLNPCRGHSQRLCVTEGSREDLTTLNHEEDEDAEEGKLGCLSFDCRQCTEAIGTAMTEVRALLDAFHRAGALYPSSQAMTGDHPLLATSLFQNRIKAMCLWYNMAMHMRLKILSVRRLLQTVGSKNKGRLPDLPCLGYGSEAGELDRQCSERQVRFDVSANPSDSSNSEASSRSDRNQPEGERDPPDQSAAAPEPLDQSAAAPDDAGHAGVEAKERDETDCVLRTDQTGQTTPEIIISDAKYGTSDTTASSESGYASERERELRRLLSDSVFNVGSLADLTRLRLLNKCQVSPYRDYHYENLKTQGVRRCMMFIHKLRKKLLSKVYYTFLELESLNHEESESVEMSDTKEDDKSQKAKEAQDDYELRRFGCWSEESLAMGLPSYRNHFLLLSSICMEAVHDWLTMRLEDRPDQPSCLTIKQLIHELKEGLDIATKMRQAFVRHIEVALRGTRAGQAARRDLLLLLRTFDASVEDVFEQYLSYLSTISAVEHVGRCVLEAECLFVARVAARGPAPPRAAAAFADIACNQLRRVMDQFESKFNHLDEVDKNSPDPSRYVFYTICREAQSVFASEREAALQAAAWARALAAQQPRASIERRRIFESLMLLRACIVKHTQTILERASVTPPDEFLHEVTDGVVARVRDLLLQVYRLGFEIHKELHRFVTERGARRSLAPGARGWLARAASLVEAEPDRALADIDAFLHARNHVSIEELLSGEPPPPPPQRERNDAHDEEAWSAAVARAIVAFARCWMRFVLERCERGRGRRPRWASQGLEFLMLACDPYNTRHLSDDEFEELKQLMDGCISHVVGSRAAAPRAAEPEPAAPRPRHRLHSPLPGATGAGGAAPAPPTPPTEPAPVPTFTAAEPSAHTRRVLEALRKLELSRDAALREMKAVGRVAARAPDCYEPRMRQVTFKWQRGLKIGAGTFGKVYTVVNTESGQLLAMKELSIAAGDRRATQRAANELRVLEAAQHPHLVRYYGIEVHREEMLIFMELCVEGSLEALVATSGALPEHGVRRYTRQLLSAVTELHARNIAHRDIKSGNIFLTNEGNCLKLGDFGCAVKIRATATAAGELQGYVGTQAYMAPEVFMKSSGHGRATDIWSLGCVVTEMASGKRPFSEYDSNYQIMFVVGMGGRPAIPESLSHEGREFCRRCLTHDPDQRPRAEELTMHHFLMVKDDDCNCSPGKFL